MRPSTAFLILCLCAVPAAADEGGWPFGGGTGPMAQGRDLWNLGPIGAKAWDADVAPPAAPQGGRRMASVPRQGKDEGPKRLRLELLFPGGPAEKAGLKIGDVIVGVGRHRFKEGSLEPLAEAITKAESKKGELTLLVERTGSGDKEKVEVALPDPEKALAKPTREPARTRLIEAALTWLAGKQQGSGGFKQTLSGLNGAVCQTALAGLAWVAGGSDLKDGPYKVNVRRAADFVMDKAGKAMTFGGREMPTGGRNLNQSTWGLAHAAIFLGELQAHSPDPDMQRALIGMGAELAKRQEDSGGWGHGPGGPNPLGYVELNILSGLALCGMGMAHEAGFDPPEEVIERAEKYLEASSNGDGGVGYSALPGQAGQGNIGRTAGCWLGFQALGLGKHDWCRKMKKWTEHNIGDVLGGHASLMIHIFLAGVAAHALGKRAEKDYWERCERDFTLARAPDGSFQPRPWRETLSMGTNSDVSFGDVWTTAAWTIVLACKPEKKGRPGLPYWMGLKTARE